MAYQAPAVGMAGKRSNQVPGAFRLRGGPAAHRARPRLPGDDDERRSDDCGADLAHPGPTVDRLPLALKLQRPGVLPGRDNSRLDLAAQGIGDHRPGAVVLGPALQRLLDELDEDRLAVVLERGITWGR